MDFKDVLVCALIMHNANFAEVAASHEFYLAKRFSAIAATVCPGINIGKWLEP
jgi:hypothetical protein